MSSYGTSSGATFGSKKYLYLTYSGMYAIYEFILSASTGPIMSFGGNGGTISMASSKVTYGVSTTTKISASYSFTSGSKYHIGIVAHSGGVGIYVNQSAITSVTDNYLYRYNHAYGMTIGAAFNDTTSYYKGNIYRYAFSDSDSIKWQLPTP